MNTRKKPQKKSLLAKIGLTRGKEQEKKNWYIDNFPQSSFRAYFQQPGKPVWTPRNYERFSDEAYTKNIVAYRCINLISQAAASVPWLLSEAGQGRLQSHPVLDLLARPNPCCNGKDFIESIISYRMISGNAYILAIAPEDQPPHELFTLRPDRVQVIAGRDALPAGYEYTVGKKTRRFMVNRLNGKSPVLHLKNFHPLDDWYGLSPIEAAAFSIDQHNNAAQWNQSLLQNGARPSGALVVKMADDGSGGVLSDEQFDRVRRQVDEQYSGAANAGRPLLLEGGLDWKEMSLSPKDMDFIESKNSSARDIALAFGCPPQLLGIPGDNTYSNLVEARLALWEQTILPLLDNLAGSLNNWLLPQFAGNLRLDYDIDSISALAPRREAVWKRIKDANFMTGNEKRLAVGMKELGKEGEASTYRQWW